MFASMSSALSPSEGAAAGSDTSRRGGVVGTLSNGDALLHGVASVLWNAKALQRVWPSVFAAHPRLDASAAAMASVTSNIVTAATRCRTIEWLWRRMPVRELRVSTLSQKSTAAISSFNLLCTLVSNALELLDDFDVYDSALLLPLSDLRSLVELLRDMLHRLCWTDAEAVAVAVRGTPSGVSRVSSCVCHGCV
jgi:hypothetical protein